MKRGIIFFTLILFVFLISLVYADSFGIGTGYNILNAGEGGAATFGTANVVTGSQNFFGRAMCKKLKGVKGYYDIKTNELILENADCPNGKILSCMKSNTEGWYNSDNELVLSGTCPDYITKGLIKEAIKEKNRVKFTDKVSECPESCECSGSTIKCILQNGREMTITAGNSGNVIVQIKGENMMTNVTLYKSGDKVYGIFKNNETKVVRIFPDQIKEKIRERLKVKLQNENITLNEDGEYEYEAEKEARLFLFIPIKAVVRAEIDPQTGEILNIQHKAWWSFLAKDVPEEEIVGASCGTVTPGYNDECCQNKGYDVWNVETAECEFVE